MFDPNRDPWVQPDAATVDEVIAAIERCPSGALTFTRTALAFAEVESQEKRATIQTHKDGPLYVRGNFVLLDDAGEMIHTANRIALCRCGKSKNPPFCDCSHQLG